MPTPNSDQRLTLRFTSDARARLQSLAHGYALVIAIPTLIAYLSIRDLQLLGGCINLRDVNGVRADTFTFRTTPVLFVAVLGLLTFYEQLRKMRADDN